MDKEQEACQLMAEAEKSLNSSKGFFSKLLGSGSKQEEACEKFVRAANMFKMLKKWNEAGNAFCKSADIQQSLQNKHESASNFVDAGNCYKKSDADAAIKCLTRAIDIYTDMGRFTVAAKHHISVAEIYENETSKLEEAISHYERAADFYKGEDSTSSANKCWLKVAAYAAQLEQYTKAIELYERVGMSSMNSPLLKYSVKEYFFKSALCHFCLGGTIDAMQSLEKYEGLFPAFSDSRECQLLKSLIETHDNQNSDAFAEAVAKYDSISRIDQWLTTILLRIKKTIGNDDEDLT
ncbi:alpha-soluble NSF attachment protein-like [Styela clava]